MRVWTAETYGGRPQFIETDPKIRVVRKLCKTVEQFVDDAVCRRRIALPDILSDFFQVGRAAPCDAKSMP